MEDDEIFENDEDEDVGDEDAGGFDLGGAEDVLGDVDGIERADKDSDADSQSADFIPSSFRSQLYDMKISKGRVFGTNINIWDKVNSCRGIQCKLFKKCPYFQSDDKIRLARDKNRRKEDIGLCRVEQKYLLHNLQPFLNLIQQVPDDFVVQTIGMHLIPLYHDLVQLKMEKASLVSASYKDSKGTIRIHPVYDQLLKTHNTIMDVWRKSKLQDIAIAVGFIMPAQKSPFSNGDDIIDGDPDSYDALSGEK